MQGMHQAHQDEAPTKQVPEWTLGDRLRKARESAGYNQTELGDLLHVAKRTVVNYEKGATEPNVWTLVGWARVTDVDEAWLIGTDIEERFRTGRLLFVAA